jgi:hypothetical protein
MPLKLTAQYSLDRQKEIADSLFDKGDYFDAVTEYKRLSFFDERGEHLYKASRRIGLSYKYGGYYNNSVKYLNQAKLNAADDEEEFTAAVDIIRVNILRGTTSRAEYLLRQLEADPRYSGKSTEIDYWRGWVHIFDDNWDEAALSFDSIDPDHPLKKLALQIEDGKYSVTFAKVISYILPGSGQIYTGNTLSGTVSLAWNVLWGYLTIKSFSEDRPLDGILIGSLLWLRFYRGNVQNAEKFAVEANINKSNEGLKYLMDNYRGRKP